MKRFSSRLLSSLAKSPSLSSHHKHAFTSLALSHPQHYSTSSNQEQSINDKNSDEAKEARAKEIFETRTAQEVNENVEQQQDTSPQEEMTVGLTDHTTRTSAPAAADAAEDATLSPYVRILLKNGTNRASRHKKPVLPQEAQMHQIRPLEENWTPECQNMPPTQQEMAFNVLRICQSQDEPTTWSIWNDIKRRNLNDFFESRTKVRDALNWLKKEGYVGTRTGIYVRANMAFYVNDALVRENFSHKSNLERYQKQCHVCKTVFDASSRDQEQLVDPEVFRWSKPTHELICLKCSDSDEERYSQLVQRMRASMLHRERIAQERDQMERLREEDPVLFEDAKRQREEKQQV
mmetsp:Transcript_8351/g.30865  ORF Transcript_8351/g.30865 Transcript_8351/m.30865 type:complete len:349 (-) Transcript_8351:99-1145(-)|eukprot:CAMPEP_0117452000 /NCGR_PEP_ID=MMETSP0759-20121206/9338_1 /TAXON_ID=63605 /ORGANISM="Percolomonas cosmopolitus, Strain WS" /LENGTH=348 /DNA_ID=CAMNT_0005244699 /DNA_START=29 /DNA_END=1075 /DNA_ORIENTATION=-